MHLLIACPGCQRQYDAGELPVGSRFHCACGETVRVPAVKAADAAVVRCRSCGGPRDRGRSSCRYCGIDFTVHEQDMHTICPSCCARLSDRARFCHHCGTRIAPQGKAGEPSDRPCPVCVHGKQARKLNHRQMGQPPMSMLECGGCAGIWLCEASFRALTERARQAPDGDATGTATADTANPARQPGPLYRRCPECKQHMNRRNFGQRSGVVIDTCKDHGIWFDAHELDGVLRWIRQGGERQARARQAEDQRVATSRQRLERQAGSTGTGWRQGGGATATVEDGGLLGELLGALFDL